MTKENKKNRKPRDPEARATNIAFALTVVLSFLGAICFRRSVGILAMTPVAFIIWGAMAFVKTDWRLRTFICVLTTFVLNTVEQTVMNDTLSFTTLCLLICLFTTLLSKSIKSKNKAPKFIGCLGIIITVFLSVIFVGNPVKAFTANSALLEYVENKYPNIDNAALGEFEYSSIYYISETNAYAIDINSSLYPTESGTLTYGENHIKDGFETKMLEKLAEPYVLEITSVLREVFPDDSFSVSFDEITTLPNKSPFSAKKNELYGDIVFNIRLGGVQTANAMIERVEDYTELLERKNIEFSKIIYKSGIGEWVRRSITVSGGSSSELDHLVLERTPTGTSNRFNRYLADLIDIK